MLFVFSLAYFLFSYVVTFGIVVSDGPSAGPVAWNVVLFTAFAMHHSVCAREPVREWIARTLPPQLERSFYVWVASVLFIATCAFWQPVPGVAWTVDGAALWALRILQAIGVWLSIQSAAMIGVLDLAGVRQAEQRPARAMDFTTGGPYGYVRHPIYSGWLLIVLAASPMTMTRLVFALVSCAYLVAAIPFEERSLREASSGGYQRYMAQVRWKVIPGLY